MLPAQQPRRHGRSAQSAFTLIELVVVIAIIALVAGSVVAVYDGVQQRAELGVAQRQLATVRDALLRFRVDMGYFPGDGPLAASELNLDGKTYVDGTTAAAKQKWVAHPLNLWMLYEKPVDKDTTKATRWDWTPAVARGWRGPYLATGLGVKLSKAGDADRGFTSVSGTSALVSRLYSVPDLIGVPSTSTTSLVWVNADGTDLRKGQAIGGKPIAFMADPSTSGWIIFRVVSAGANGVHETVTTPAGDDIAVEVGRRRTL